MKYVTVVAALATCVAFSASAMTTDIDTDGDGMASLAELQGYSNSKHNLVRSKLGFALGLAIVAAPWMAKFTANIATLNAVVVGLILALVAFFEPSKPLRMQVS
jgi:hypothetical protein